MNMADKMETSNDDCAEPKLLNIGKAGMEEVDVKTANKIILQASKGSNFYVRQQEKQGQIEQKIQHLKHQLSRLTNQQMMTARLKMDRLAEQFEKKRNVTRVIVHIDMDAFYASVEIRDEPRLAAIPMAVGGSHMLCTSNYHARKFGVRAGMPGFLAKKLCPTLVIVPVNFEKYTRVSKEMQEVLATYDAHYCSMGLDEAYLDITHLVDGSGSSVESKEQNTREDIASTIVNEIRQKIFEKTNLTASAGIAVNKMLAKICSDKNKPNGQFLLEFSRDKIMEYVTTMPISKVCGIGNVTTQILNAIDVHTGSDLWSRRDVLSLLFSEISSESFLRISLGMGSTTVHKTFKDTSDQDELKQRCRELCVMLSEDLKEANIIGKTVTLKLKTATFHVTTTAKSMLCHTSDVESICATALSLLEQNMNCGKPPTLRLMGVRMSSLTNEAELTANQRAKQVTIDAFLKGEDNSNLHECPICGHQERGVTMLSRHMETCATPELPDAVEVSQIKIETPIPDWTCPVCEQRVNLKEDDDKIGAFNKHLDNCLNRKAIREVLHSEEKLYKANSRKVSRSNEDDKTPRKKSKLNEPSTSNATIDRFLTKKKQLNPSFLKEPV